MPGTFLIARMYIACLLWPGAVLGAGAVTVSRAGPIPALLGFTFRGRPPPEGLLGLFLSAVQIQREKIQELRLISR